MPFTPQVNEKMLPHTLDLFDQGLLVLRLRIWLSRYLLPRRLRLRQAYGGQVGNDDVASISNGWTLN